MKDRVLGFAGGMIAGAVAWMGSFIVQNRDILFNHVSTAQECIRSQQVHQSCTMDRPEAGAEPEQVQVGQIWEPYGKTPDPFKRNNRHMLEVKTSNDGTVWVKAGRIVESFEWRPEFPQVIKFKDFSRDCHFPGKYWNREKLPEKRSAPHIDYSNNLVCAMPQSQYDGLMRQLQAGQFYGYATALSPEEEKEWLNSWECEVSKREFRKNKEGKK